VMTVGNRVCLRKRCGPESRMVGRRPPRSVNQEQMK
jgi:hypothetical protein